MTIKTKIILASITAAALFIGGYFTGHHTNSSELDIYKRQVQGELSQKEEALEAANNDLGVSKSQLFSQQALNDILKKDKGEYDKKFQDFVKKYNLEISSRDQTLAQLQQTTTGGTTEINGAQPIETTQQPLSYSYTDPYNRFHLLDPDIYKSNNETFTIDQKFKITGEIYKQKDGSLETRRIVLREIIQNSDGTTTEIPNAKATILSSQFQYSNDPQEEPKAPGIFHPRLIGIANVNLIDHTGQTNFGLGAEIFNYRGFGLSSGFAADFQNVSRSQLQFGLEYQPPPLNVGFGVFGGTNMDKFGSEWSLNTGLVFYITK
jgi:hypothetical protein